MSKNIILLSHSLKGCLFHVFFEFPSNVHAEFSKGCLKAPPLAPLDFEPVLDNFTELGVEKPVEERVDGGVA